MSEEQKSIKISIPGFDTIAEAAKDFLQKVITPPLEEVGLLFADQVKLWRFKNQVNIVNKAEAYLKEKGIKTKKVSLKILAPLLEFSSLEEDKNLQEKWAALLAHTAAEKSNIETTLYSHILSQLSQKDAAIFEFVYSFSTETQTHTWQNHSNNLPSTLTIGMKTDKIFDSKIITAKFESAHISIDNLMRLRLIKETSIGLGGNEGFMVLTDLGFYFRAAVNFL